MTTYQDEPGDERSCHADAWAERWSKWIKAFLGVDDGERLTEPWCPDVDELRRNEAAMFAEIAAEYKQEQEATSAQQDDDLAMAAALAQTEGEGLGGEQAEQRRGGRNERAEGLLPANAVLEGLCSNRRRWFHVQLVQ